MWITDPPRQRTHLLSLRMCAALSNPTCILKGVYAKRNCNPVIKTKKGFNLKEWEVRIPQTLKPTQIHSKQQKLRTQCIGHLIDIKQLELLR